MRGFVYIIGLTVLLLTATPLQAMHHDMPQWRMEQDSLHVYYSNGRLTIQNLTEPSVLEIYNIMGRKVYSQKVAAGSTTLDISLAKGIYIIRLGKFTKKIAVR